MVLTLGVVLGAPGGGLNGEIGAGFGLDLLGFSLIWLSVWVTALMFVARAKVKHEEDYPQVFAGLGLGLMTILIMTFATTNMMVFYVSFEARLIPTLLLILGWGYQPERMQAGLYLIIYTLFASLPLLGGILALGEMAMTYQFAMS